MVSVCTLQLYHCLYCTIYPVLEHRKHSRQFKSSNRPLIPNTLQNGSQYTKKRPLRALPITTQLPPRSTNTHISSPTIMDASTAFFASRGITTLPTRETRPFSESSSTPTSYTAIHSAAAIAANTSLCATGTASPLRYEANTDSWICTDTKECEVLSACASTASTKVGA